MMKLLDKMHKIEVAKKTFYALACKNKGILKVIGVSNFYPYCLVDIANFARVVPFQWSTRWKRMY